MNIGKPLTARARLDTENTRDTRKQAIATRRKLHEAIKQIDAPLMAKPADMTDKLRPFIDATDKLPGWGATDER